MIASPPAPSPTRPNPPRPPSIDAPPAAPTADAPSTPSQRITPPPFPRTGAGTAGTQAPRFAPATQDSTPPGPAPTRPGNPALAQDPQKLWAALLSELPAAMIWARQLTLKKIDAGYAHVAPLPGKRDVVKFMTQSRRDELAGLISRTLGQPVRVNVEVPADDGAEAQRASGHGPLSERDIALGLPLVRQVFEMFPDSTMIEVRPEAEVEAASNPVPASDSGSLDSDSDDASLSYDSMQDMNDDDDADR